MARARPYRSEESGARRQAPPGRPSHRAAVRSLRSMRADPMTTLKLYVGGWLALPAALRRTLGVGTGDRLEVELVDGTIRLRPAAGIKGAAASEPEATEPAAEAPAPVSSPPAITSTKRPAGRPRK